MARKADIQTKETLRKMLGMLGKRNKMKHRRTHKLTYDIKTTGKLGKAQINIEWHCDQRHTYNPNYKVGVKQMTLTKTSSKPGKKRRLGK
jgi:hypothetical protein